MVQALVRCRSCVTVKHWADGSRLNKLSVAIVAVLALFLNQLRRAMIKFHHSNTANNHHSSHSMANSLQFKVDMAKHHNNRNTGNSRQHSRAMDKLLSNHNTDKLHNKATGSSNHRNSRLIRSPASPWVAGFTGSNS